MQNKPVRSFWSTILWAGALVGLLDISSACINYYLRTGKSPVIIFPFIASAIFGKTAMEGKEMIAVGGLMHFMIAYAFTIFFFLIYPKLPFLSWNRLLTGILYGALIWTLMTLVLVPLTRAKAARPSWERSPIDMGILMVAIGIPLSLIAYRYYAGKRNS